MADQSSRLLSRLQASGLLDATQVAELARLPEARGPDPRPLARAILQRRWVTSYQLNQVVAGREKDLRVGPYLVLDRLGEGGMGQVFKARHSHMNRLVALKVIRKEKLANDTAVKRFYNEIQAAAQLQHPNIVIAYDAGQAGQTHFFAMEFVDGTDLSRLVKERGPLPAATACDYARQAALGLQHAHEKGLVHRDIKPANLLVDRHGTVKVLDMGLARLGENFERGRNLTRMGQVLGTPDYLAPEQALDSRSVDIRADLYSLGCSLYFLLAGRPPYRADSLPQLLLAHQAEEPTPLRQVRPDLPADLEPIVRRLMAKKPADRYASPAEVAEALGRIGRAAPPPVPLAAPRAEAPEGPFADLTETGDKLHRPPARPDATHAEEEPPPGSRRKVAATNQMFLYAGIGGAVLAAALAVGLVVAFALGGKKEQAQAKAGKGRTKKDAEPGQATTNESGKKDGGQKDGGQRPAETPEARLGEGGHHRLALHPGGMVHGLAISSDGSRAATLGADREVRVLDLATGKVVQKAGKGVLKGGSILRFSQDGRRLLIGQDNEVLEWGLEANKFEGAGGRTGRFLSPDGRMALSYTVVDGAPHCLAHDLATGEKLGAVGAPGLTAHQLVYSWDSKQALAVTEWKGSKGLIHLINLQGRLSSSSFTLPAESRLTASAAIFGPGRGELLVGCADGSVVRVMLKGGKPGAPRLLARHEGAVTTLALSGGGTRVLSGGADGVVRLTDLGRGEEIGQFKKHTQGVLLVGWVPGDNRALSTGMDGAVWLWDLSSPTSAPQDKPAGPGPNYLLTGGFRGHRGRAVGVDWSADGKWIVSGGEDGQVLLWDASTGKQVALLGRALGGGRRGTLFVRLSRSGKRVVAGGASNYAEMWDLGTRKSEGILWLSMPQRARWEAVAADVASDDEQVVFAVNEQIVIAESTIPGGTKGTRSEPFQAGARVTAVLWQPGTLNAAFGDARGVVRVYDTQAKKVIFTWAPHVGKPVTALAYDAKARRIVTAGADGELALRDAREWTKASLKRIKGHQGPVHCVAFLPDGEGILTGGKDGTVRLWQASTGKQLACWDVKAEVARLAIDPAGKKAVLCVGGQVRVLGLTAK